jgi:WD40 repeat protein
MAACVEGVQSKTLSFLLVRTLWRAEQVQSRMRHWLGPCPRPVQNLRLQRSLSFIRCRELGFRPPRCSGGGVLGGELTDAYSVEVRSPSEMIKSKYFYDKLFETVVTDYSIGYGPEDLRRLRRVQKLPHGGCVNCASWSSDLEHLATGSDDRLVKIWRLGKDDPVEIIETGHRGNIFCVEQTPQSPDTYYTCAMDGELRWHSLNMNVPSETVLATNDDSMMLMFKFVPGTGGHELATAEENGVCRFVDLRTKSTVDTVRYHLAWAIHRGEKGFPSHCLQTDENACVRAIDFNPRNPTLFMIGGTAGPVVHLYDRRNLSEPAKEYPLIPLNLNPVNPRTGSKRSISCVEYNQTGERVLVNMMDGGVHSFDPSKDLSYDGIEMNSPLSTDYHDTLPGPSHHRVYYGGVNCRTFLKTAKFFGPRDEFIVAGTDVGDALIWNSRTCRLQEILPAADRSGICNGVIPHPTYNMLCTYGIDTVAHVWAVRECESVESIHDLFNPKFAHFAHKPNAEDKSVFVLMDFYSEYYTRADGDSSTYPRRSTPWTEDIESFLSWKFPAELGHVACVPPLCMVEKKSIITALEKLKLKGNEYFKAGKLNSALDCYFHITNSPLHIDLNSVPQVLLVLDAQKNSISVFLKMLEQVADTKECERRIGITVARRAVMELYHSLTAAVENVAKFVEWCQSKWPIETTRYSTDLQKVYFRGARGHFSMGNYERAFDDISKARELDPNDKQVLKLMKKIKLMQKKNTAKLAKGMKKMFA